MKFEKLECVVLSRDVSEYGLRAGDLGTVVETYPGGEVEVEFVRGSGETQAVVTLGTRDIRKMDERDVLATRRLVEV